MSTEKKDKVEDKKEIYHCKDCGRFCTKKLCEKCENVDKDKKPEKEVLYTRYKYEVNGDKFTETTTYHYVDGSERDEKKNGNVNNDKESIKDNCECDQCVEQDLEYCECGEDEVCEECIAEVLVDINNGLNDEIDRLKSELVLKEARIKELENKCTIIIREKEYLPCPYPHVFPYSGGSAPWSTPYNPSPYGILC